MGQETSSSSPQPHIPPRRNRTESEAPRPLETDQQRSGNAGRVTPPFRPQGHHPKFPNRSCPNRKLAKSHTFSTISARLRRLSDVSNRREAAVAECSHVAHKAVTPPLPTP